MAHLLVTNDFPPKVGGIQSYLWELWRRLDPTTFTVLTTPYAGAAEWDAAQPFRVVRTPERVLLPTPGLARRIDALAAEAGAALVMLDPALPVGLLGPRLARPYGVVLHGAEIAVPGRLPGSRALLGRVLRGASEVVAAGGYPAAEGERAAGRPLPVTIVPPGVDTARFVPLDPEARAKARALFDLPEDARVVVSLSRLVPRKGMDVLVRAAAALGADRPDLVVAIGGSGRDRGRLDRLVAGTRAPVRMFGPRARRRPAGPLRLRRRVRHAVPQPVGGPRAGGFRHRVPRGGGVRRAAGGGHQRGSGRGGGRRRDRCRGAGAERRRRGGGSPRVPARRRRAAAPARRGRPHPCGRRVRLRRAGGTAGRSAVAVVTPPGAAGGPDAAGAADADAAADQPGGGAAGPGPARAAGGPGAGEAIVRCDVWATGVFAVVSLAAAAVPDPLEYVAVPLAVVLFVAGSVAFLWAYAVAIGRSRYEVVTMGGVFFLGGGVAPAATARVLRAALAVQVVVAVAVAAARPFTALAAAVLAPMLGLGLMALWGARHGRFAPKGGSADGGDPDVSRG